MNQESIGLASKQGGSPGLKDLVRSGGPHAGSLMSDTHESGMDLASILIGTSVLI